jgi:hypothetical protein
MRPTIDAIDIKKVPFARKFSYLALFQDEDEEGSRVVDTLYLGITRGSTGVIPRPKLMKLRPMREGRVARYRALATPSLLRLECDEGSVELCHAEPDLLRVRGRGLGLRISAEMQAHEGSVDREDGTWEVAFALLGSLLFVPIKGRMEAVGPWEWELIKPGDVSIDFEPDSSGGFECAIHLSDANGRRRPSYDGFDACVAEVDADYRSWLDKYPSVPVEYEETRKLAAYVVWSHVMRPKGLIERPMVYMQRTMLANAFGWQQSYQALALADDIEESWEFLLAMFDHQSPEGQLPDWTNDVNRLYLTTKPPFQGFAICWILDHEDVSRLSKEKVEALYAPLCKFADWWFEYRDSDHDGIPQYNHSDESGWDDATIFSGGLPVESPDLSAFLVLMLEACGRLAALIGRQAESTRWLARSERLLDDMIKTFWNGSKFIALHSTTHEVIECESMAVYQPIILGKRLPQAIIDTIAARLASPDFLCEHGYASESLLSPLLCLDKAFMRGSLIAPGQLMLGLGLMEAGKRELAIEGARRWCSYSREVGLVMGQRPLDREPWTGREYRDRPYAFPAAEWLSWPSAIFLILASRALGESSAV